MKNTVVFCTLTAFLVAVLWSECNTMSAEVVGWGNNMCGQATGTPSAGSSTGIVTVAGIELTNVVSVACGFAHGLALMADGTVAGWGRNMDGQATGSETEYPHNSSGAVSVRGALLRDVKAIAANGNGSMALKTDGTVVGWGTATVPSNLSNVVAIAGDSTALLADGTVATWHGGRLTQSGLTNVLMVATGGDVFERGLALKHGGAVVAWGKDNIYHHMTPPDDMGKAAAISVGWDHSLALMQDGTVYGWGFNQFGQATGTESRSIDEPMRGLVTLRGSILSNITAVAAGNGFSLALKQDGTVIAWGCNRRGQTEVPAELSHVIAIAAGNDFCLAVTTNAP